MLLDDPDLFVAYRAEVEAPTRKEALQKLADVAVADTAERLPAIAETAAVLGAAHPDAFTIYGCAIPLDGVEHPAIDLTARIEES